MSVGLTATQRRLLCFIHGYQVARGYSPSLIEMAGGIGSSSKSWVHQLLLNLEARGKIRRLRHRERAIEVLDAPTLPSAPDGAPLYFVAVTG